MALTDKLKAIANAIRGKTGGTEELTLDQMATAIEGIEVGGSWDGVYDTLAEVIVGAHSFYNADYIKSVNLPRCLSVEQYAFSSCQYLESVTLKSYEILHLKTGSFSNDMRLKSVTLETDYTKPFVVEKDAFSFCESLETFTGMAGYFGDGAFWGCISLKNVDCKKVSIIGTSCFRECASLEKITLPFCEIIGADAFYKCENLFAVILPSDVVCQVDVTALLDSKIMTAEGLPTGEGFIYITASMFDAYRAAYEPAFEQIGATGLFDVLFRKIEDYPEICG